MKKNNFRISRPNVNENQPGLFKKTYFLLRELSWTIGAIAGIYALYLQYQQAKPIFYSECQIAENGQMKIEIAKDIETVGFYTSCALRNVGAKSADLVDVRSGLLSNGLIPYKPELTPRFYERADEITANGEGLNKPLSIQPGSQASIKAYFSLPINREESPKVFEAIRLCQSVTPIKTTNQFKLCLFKASLTWTDYLRGSYREPVMFETSFYEGLAGVFMLSDGNFVSSELQFKYGWGWSCRDDGNQHLRPLPKYIGNEFCRDAPSK